MDEAGNLNTRQLKFALGVLEGKSATQAAIDAGYKPAYAGANADKLLKNTKIAQYLQKKRGKIEADAEVNAANVLRELARIAFGTSRMSWEAFGLELKLDHKLRALEMLAKHLGLFDVADRSDKTLMQQMYDAMTEGVGEYDDGSQTEP